MNYSFVDENDLLLGGGTIDYTQAVLALPQWRIFKDILKTEVKLDIKMYKNPCRKHNIKDCFFRVSEKNILTFVDFGDPQFPHRSCLDMYCHLTGLNLKQGLVALQTYYKDQSDENSKTTTLRFFSDSASETVEDEEDITNFRKYPILFKPRKYFTINDVIIWMKVGVPTSSLLEDSVYPVESFTIPNTDRTDFITITPRISTFAYNFKPRVKLYQPENPDKRFKWLSNCDENDIYFLDKLPEIGDKLIIQKSYKDGKCIRYNYGINYLIAFQNEGCKPSEHIILDLAKRFKKILVFFDNDETGERAALIITDYINSIVPNKAKAIKYPKKVKQKDVAQFYEERGKEATFQLLTKLEVI